MAANKNPLCRIDGGPAMQDKTTVLFSKKKKICRLSVSTRTISKEILRFRSIVQR